ncbi:DUF2945 domain-containing protein [Subtercola lobariae]|uniref:Hypervirulence associated protein TUDOR domain-containing protein n=1 Tax=Subtercola lobariae TaxID=1588641 RepID=A0A917BBD7_9MICO|nr:DUF2945 domain-containing protein [Subtercola lobariae]GGF29995.1 hypothetical protein GCM10011399_23980 [Subtercola lobariae]
MSEFTKGDHVTWQSHGGTAEGHVEKKITDDTHAAKRDVKASRADPQYLVQSEKSGGEAVHKPEALTKKASAATKSGGSKSTSGSKKAK